MRKIKISDYLMTGAENARTARELAELIGCSRRDITASVESERREGIPICSSTGANPGYYLARTQDDLTAMLARLHHRAGEIHKTRGELKKALDTLPLM